MHLLGGDVLEFDRDIRIEIVELLGQDFPFIIWLAGVYPGSKGERDLLIGDNDIRAKLRRVERTSCRRLGRCFGGGCCCSFGRSFSCCLRGSFSRNWSLRWRSGGGSARSKQH